ncbi:acetate/propionate family kinase [Methylocystis parvus]|uniref:Acetate kinase n=1 Tax=Methylocystis parvus TaxID=134 RepID=A0A6B8M4L4_9HYPH|nr:acetate/propionate family kinase [Methylocystis parvus]QGM96709.1 acetate/propionate family kinase [Methylocystis parvus]WBJ99425.1 acetate/propionate family kinase [Methylocystis parvus OBBP]
MSSIAVVNAGSSSLKFAVFDAAETPVLRLKGAIDGIGATPRARLSRADGATLLDEALAPENFDHAAATRTMMRIAAPWLDGADISAVGHRVVHGGGVFSAPLRITEADMEALARFIPLAPLHQPHNLAVIRAMLAEHPQLPQVACFDTAFHATQPPIAQAFALPRKYSQAGLRRYGFHGISYQYVAGRLKEVAPDLASRRVIVAHLGNGASLCGMIDGGSVASTMGFTTVDGLMMGTRCGALDPGALLHLMDHYGLGPREVEDLIYRQSGLLGVSGLSADMRALRASAAAQAKEAIALFVYRIRREIGSLAAALGGLDALVFTAGIGENDAATRAEVAAGCAWLGVELDDTANRAAQTKISAPQSSVAVFVIPTNEELEIARSAYRLVRPN